MRCLFHTTFIFKFYIYNKQVYIVYIVLCYQFPFVGFIFIFIFHILFYFHSSFNYAADCAGVVAFQSFLIAYPFFHSHDYCVYCCMVCVHFLPKAHYHIVVCQCHIYSVSCSDLLFHFFPDVHRVSAILQRMFVVLYVHVASITCICFHQFTNFKQFFGIDKFVQHFIL